MSSVETLTKPEFSQEIIYFSANIDKKIKDYLSILNNMARRINDARLRGYDPEHVRDITRNLDQARREAHNELAEELSRGGFIDIPKDVSGRKAEEIARKSADNYINIYQTITKN